MDALFSKVTYNTITDLHHGQRIDNYLVSLLKNIPKSRIYQAIRKGEVRVNKKRVKPDYRLQSDDAVRIPPFSQSPPTEKMIPARLKGLWEDILLYEDDDLLIINKPSKLAVHSGSGVDYGIIDIARAFHPQGEALQLVHRLDRDTSGCLLISKTRPMLLGLQTLLQTHEIRKKYWALTKGHWVENVTTVEAALCKNQVQAGERMVIVDDDEGKSAKTVFTVKKQFKKMAYVEADLYSGRTHQIRVHAQYLEHPLAGDEKYGDVTFNKFMQKFALKRLFLHAHALDFISPLTGKKIIVEAPLPEDLQNVLLQLEAGE